jgi:hypothetical protein
LEAQVLLLIVIYTYIYNIYIILYIYTTTVIIPHKLRYKPNKTMAKRLSLIHPSTNTTGTSPAPMPWPARGWLQRPDLQRSLGSPENSPARELIGEKHVPWKKGAIDILYDSMDNIMV